MLGDKISVVSRMYLLLRVAGAPLIEDSNHAVNGIAQRSTGFALLCERDCYRETGNRLPVFDAICTVQNVAYDVATVSLSPAPICRSRRSDSSTEKMSW